MDSSSKTRREFWIVDFPSGKRQVTWKQVNPGQKYLDNDDMMAEPTQIIHVQEILPGDKDLQAEIERLREQLNQFESCGTDGCKGCETGRVTMFTHTKYCIQCRPADYEL